MKLVFLSVLVSTIQGGLFSSTESVWEPVCGEVVQNKLKSEWRRKSEPIEKVDPTTSLFWKKKHQDLLFQRTSYIKNKIPDIFESVLASIDDEFKKFKQMENPNFVVRGNEFVDENGKEVKCKAYLDMLYELVQENEELMVNALNTALKKKWISNKEKIRFLKTKILHDTAKQNWEQYNSKLTSICDNKGLDLKTVGEGGSIFQEIDKNDIKRIKWGLSKHQLYPKSVKPRMNDEEFRRIIRTAANYWMCAAHVVLEETPEETPDNENHILFTFGSGYIPIDAPSFNNTRMGLMTLMCPWSEGGFGNSSFLLPRDKTTRDFPYYRQKDFELTTLGVTEGNRRGEKGKKLTQGICGRDVYIADDMSAQDISSNEDTKKLLKDLKDAAPRWIRKSGSIILDDPGKMLDADEVSLAFIIAHEIGHAIGLDHGSSTEANLMFEQPKKQNTDLFRKFFKSGQMTKKKCQEFQKELHVMDTLNARLLFEDNTKQLKQHQAKPLIRQKLNEKLNQEQCGINLCNCGFDGLKNCMSKIKSRTLPLTGTSLADSMKTTSTITTTTIAPKIVLEDGMKCQIKVAKLVPKYRVGFIPSYPDLYYKLKLNDKVIRNSRKDHLPDRLEATWDVDFEGDHFENSDTVEIEFWDADDNWVNPDDFIGKFVFRLSEDNAQVRNLGGKKSKYRNENSQASFDCNLLFFEE